MRWQRPRWPRLITNDLHNHATGLALVFIGVHGVALLLDPYMRFTWQEIFVPLASHYRPLWMAAGIVGAYAMPVVWISTQLRARIGYAVWRRLHTLAFAVYVLSTVHGLGMGTDTRRPWALEFYAGSVLLVGALLVNRLLTPAGVHGRAHPRLAALTAAVMVAGLAWAATGPTQAGWSAIAGHIL